MSDEMKAQLQATIRLLHALEDTAEFRVDARKGREALDNLLIKQGQLEYMANQRRMR
jgi:hypothetical protein